MSFVPIYTQTVEVGFKSADVYSYVHMHGVVPLIPGTEAGAGNGPTFFLREGAPVVSLVSVVAPRTPSQTKLPPTDTHLYQVPGCNDVIGVTIVGEFSNSTNDCGLFIDHIPRCCWWNDLRRRLQSIRGLATLVVMQAANWLYPRPCRLSSTRDEHVLLYLPVLPPPSNSAGMYAHALSRYASQTPYLLDYDTIPPTPSTLFALETIRVAGLDCDNVPSQYTNVKTLSHVPF